MSFSIGKPQEIGLVAKLPPLNAVKAFEASARLGGFSQAARELGVTAGAVGQQVKLLEEFFDKQLFTRRNNQLQLTDNRRLPDFLAAEPEVRCEFRVEDDPVDFAKHHIDLRICYGRHLYPEMVTRSLLRDVVTPLCAPDYLARRATPLTDPSEIQDSELIHIDWGGSFASYPSWAAWFAAAGAPRSPRVELGHTRCPASPSISRWRAAALRWASACWRGRNWPMARWWHHSSSASHSATTIARCIRIRGPASAWGKPSSTGYPETFRKSIG
jgi:DNA-binding transcriptional LysR family regulator